MQHVFILSKNPSFPNYLFLLIDEVYPNHCALSPDYQEDLNLIIVDTETVHPEEIAEFNSEIPIVLFCNNIKPLLIQYTSRYDINGVLSLSMEASEIMKTIQTALSKDIFYNEAMISMLFSNKANEIAERISSLTERESEILTFMRKDLTNEEIAEKLSLSVRTVNAHKGNIMRKIGCKTTSGLIQILFDYSVTFKR
ncbi:LuxR C-terminal-related transcriptional regulator [Ekhidna sp.]|uniref:LuxR C-terminal-related transcriptional regulator n=1 Tax=Ekhidna sp. TaxID=2608089 RepID=UPI003B50D782